MRTPEPAARSCVWRRRYKGSCNGAAGRDETEKETTGYSPSGSACYGSGNGIGGFIDGAAVAVQISAEPNGV